jgi:hypothetical protein
LPLFTTDASVCAWTPCAKRKGANAKIILKIVDDGMVLISQQNSSSLKSDAFVATTSTPGDRY